MAIIKVTDVVHRVAYMLTDDEHARWTQAKLLDWFNEAQREIAVKRPDSVTVSVPMSCIDGARQTMPDDAIRLLDVVRTIGGRGITKIDQDLLSVHVPGWDTMPRVDEPQHYTYDERLPGYFYLYPPVNAGISVEIIYPSIPPIILITNFVTDTQTLGVDDFYANAIQEYMLHRAWAKDAEWAGNEKKSAAHRNLFESAMLNRNKTDNAMADKQR